MKSEIVNNHRTMNSPTLVNLNIKNLKEMGKVYLKDIVLAIIVKKKHLGYDSFTEWFFTPGNKFIGGNQLKLV